MTRRFRANRALSRRRFDCAALQAAQALVEEPIEGVFLPVWTGPQRLARLQIAHHGDELLLLPQLKLVQSSIAQGGLLAAPGPALQMARIFGMHRGNAPRECAAFAKSQNCNATHRAPALSQASPAASLKRMLNEALPGNSGTVSAFTPQSGQRTRHSSTATVAMYSKHGKSPTSRLYLATIRPSGLPHPEWK